jgi:uncharacterized membrane protein
MQIQRWQSLMLLIAAILMGVLNFLPIATTPDAAQLLTIHSPVLLILDILITVLLLILIFMYKNLHLQMQVTAITIVLLVVFAAIAGDVIMNIYAQVAWLGALPLYVIAFALTIGARCFMRRDLNLLRSADRLR